MITLEDIVIRSWRVLGHRVLGDDYMNGHNVLMGIMKVITSTIQNNPQELHEINVK